MNFFRGEKKKKDLGSSPAQMSCTFLGTTQATLNVLGFTNLYLVITIFLVKTVTGERGCVD